MFGFETFGRIYGFAVCISGLINFCQTGLENFIDINLKGDHTGVNIVMGTANTALCALLTGYVILKHRAAQSKMLRGRLDDGTGEVPVEVDEVEKPDTVPST